MTKEESAKIIIEQGGSCNKPTFIHCNACVCKTADGSCIGIYEKEALSVAKEYLNNTAPAPKNTIAFLEFNVNNAGLAIMSTQNDFDAFYYSGVDPIYGKYITEKLITSFNEQLSTVIQWKAAIIVNIILDGYVFISCTDSPDGSKYFFMRGLK